MLKDDKASERTEQHWKTGQFEQDECLLLQYVTKHCRQRWKEKCESFRKTARHHLLQQKPCERKWWQRYIHLYQTLAERLPCPRCGSRACFPVWNGPLNWENGPVGDNHIYTTTVSLTSSERIPLHRPQNSKIHIFPLTCSAIYQSRLFLLKY